MGTLSLSLSLPFLLLSFKGFKRSQAVQISRRSLCGTNVGGRAPSRPPMTFLPGPFAACGSFSSHSWQHVVSLPLLPFLLPPPPFLSLVIGVSRMNVAIAKTKPDWAAAWRGQTTVLSPSFARGRPDPLPSRDFMSY